jgi:hypothetical protein
MRTETRRRATEHRAHSERVTLTGLVTAQGSQDETHDAAEHRAEIVTRDAARRAVQRELDAIRGLPSRASRVSAWIDLVTAAVDAVQDAETDAHHCKARALLASLGLPRLGRAYIAAYVASAMPGVTGNDLSVEERTEIVHEIARTLGLSSPDVLRVYVSRSRKAIPSAETHDYIAHADVMGVTAETETGKAHAAKTEHEPRTRIASAEVEGETVECTCYAGKDDAGVARAADPLGCEVHALTAHYTDLRATPSTRVASWTETLRESTRDRLEAASDIRDARRSRVR